MSGDIRSPLLHSDSLQGRGSAFPVISSALSGSREEKHEAKELKIAPLPRLTTFRLTVDTALEYGLEAFYESLQRQAAEFQAGKLPCELRFKNLSYTVMEPVKEVKRSMSDAFTKLFCAPFRSNMVREKTVLHKVSGVLRPGTMTLVMGPPGCGKTSFLKALAGRLPRSKTKGEILLNGVEAQDLLLQNFIAYINQSDDHLPLITVRETLTFAEACTRQHTHEAKLQKLEALWPDIVMKTLNIAHVADTVVGNELLRGISGGQRKRVTVGEMLVSPKPIFLCDEITTGLDSATAFDVIHGLQAAARVFRYTFVCALLQPSPEVVNLFDDIILMSPGEIAYHGPRDQVLNYFSRLGFEPPFYKDRADFLQELLTHVGQKYVRPGVADHPRNASEFVTRWKESDLFQETVRAMKAPFTHPLTVEDRANLSNEFVNTWWQSTKLVTSRQWKLTVRNMDYIRKRVFSNIFIAVLLGWLCYQVADSNWRLHYSVFFFIATFLALGNLPVMATLLAERPIFYKQREANFFPTSSYVLAVTLCSLPLTIVESLLFSSIAYFLVGLTSTAANFFFFVITIILLSISLSALFRFLAACLPDLTTAQPVVGGTIILQTLFAGFIITQDKINPGWIWAYWLTPLSWALRCLALNEFQSSDYSEADGTAYLNNMAIQTDSSWKAWGLIYMAVFWVCFVYGQVIALDRVRYHGVRKERQISDEHDPFRDEEAVDMSTTAFALPFTPVTLLFEEVSYFVDIPKEKERLQLLRKVTGYAKPGRLIALMGESGAGKTTLLDVLASRKTGGYIEGNILFNGSTLKPHEASRMIGYVEQMDIHSPTATVREALLFSAGLRLSREVSQQAREEFVEQVLTVLELLPIADARIGDRESGLSLEQRKRVTVGVELVANPPIIFLDEPTSGLDSRAAQVVMRVISRIAQAGRTVICTIHQPSAEIVSWFDDLLLLVAGGKVAYMGPLGKDCSQLIDYLQGFPTTPKITAGKNPADWMLEVVGQATEGEDFGTRFANSKQKEEADAEVMKLAQEFKHGEMKSMEISTWAQPYNVQFRYCVLKAARHYWRSPEYSFVRLIFMITVACLYGTVFYQLAYSDISGLQSRIALIYSTTIFSGVVTMQSAIPFLSAERAVYYRERAASTYAVLPYAFSITMCEMPYLVVTSLIFVVILYYLVGLESGFDKLFFYCLVYTLYSIFQVYFGQFLAVVMPTNQVAALTGSGLVTLWNLFCGFLIPKPSIPTFWIWLYWSSPLRYAVEALEASQLYCDTSVKPNDCPTVSVYTGNGTVPYPVWDYVHDEYAFDHNFIWDDVVILAAMVAIARILKFLALKFVSHLKR